MIKLYNPRPIEGKSFEGVKRCTVPNQSLSLQEIVRRFVRRESVPVFNEGVYETRFGDMEKLDKLDLFDKHERANEIKSQISKFNKKQKAAAEAAANPPTPAPATPAPATP